MLRERRNVLVLHFLEPLKALVAHAHRRYLRQCSISARASLALVARCRAGGISDNLSRWALQMQIVLDTSSNGLARTARCGDCAWGIMYGAGDICGMGSRITVSIGGYGKSRGGGYRGMDAAIIGPAKLGTDNARNS